MTLFIYSHKIAWPMACGHCLLQDGPIEKALLREGLVVIASGIWVVGSLAAPLACCGLSLGRRELPQAVKLLLHLHHLAGLWPPLQGCSVGSSTTVSCSPIHHTVHSFLL